MWRVRNPGTGRQSLPTISTGPRAQRSIVAVALGLPAPRPRERLDQRDRDQHGELGVGGQQREPGRRRRRGRPHRLRAGGGRPRGIRELHRIDLLRAATGGGWPLAQARRNARGSTQTWARKQTDGNQITSHQAGSWRGLPRHFSPRLVTRLSEHVGFRLPSTPGRLASERQRHESR